jgi:hypothetical protein
MSLLSSYTTGIDSVKVGEVVEVLPTSSADYIADDYLLADGSIVSQATYPDLYSKIGLIQDGLDSWTARITGATGINGNVLYGNDKFVASITSPSGNLVTSTNGVTWSYDTVVNTNAVTLKYYSNGIYFGSEVTYATIDHILTSTDAINWTYRDPITTFPLTQIIYGNGLYVYGAQGTVDTIGTSTDSQTWYSIGTGAIVPTEIAYGNNRYIAVGAKIGSSADGIRWSRTDTTNTITNLTYVN